MGLDTKQMLTWKGDFGKQYTDRNPQNAEDVEQLYLSSFGFPRTELNERFLADIPRDIRILEVGCNVGSQLDVLSKMGFQHLYGVEVQRYAVEIAKAQLSNIDVIAGSAYELPFKDGFFDLVFTSGVLIHISPETIPIACAEIIRCSNRYIWGCEYYSDTTEEIPYRGNNSLAWKTNFPQVFFEADSGLTLLKEERISYLSSNNVDVMYLMTKAP